MPSRSLPFNDLPITEEEDEDALSNEGSSKYEIPLRQSAELPFEVVLTLPPIDEEANPLSSEALPPPTTEAPVRSLARNQQIQTSLDHLRIKTVVSSDDDSELEMQDDGMSFDSPVSDTFPDVEIFEEIKSRKAHTRAPSQDLKLTAIQKEEAEFSRSLMEQVQEHKRSLLQMADQIAIEKQSNATLEEQSPRAAKLSVRHQTEVLLVPSPVNRDGGKNILVSDFDAKDFQEHELSFDEEKLEEPVNDTKVSQNELQTVQDAQKILFEPIANEELKLLEEKSKTINQLWR